MVDAKRVDRRLEPPVKLSGPHKSLLVHWPIAGASATWGVDLAVVGALKLARYQARIFPRKRAGEELRAPRHGTKPKSALPGHATLLPARIEGLRERRGVRVRRAAL